MNHDFYVRAFRNLSCVIALFCSVTGGSIAESPPPILGNTVLKADFEKDSYSVSDLLAILGENGVPVALETGSYTEDSYPFDRKFALPKNVTSIGDVLRIIETRTGLKCSLSQGIARLHDTAFEKTLGTDPLEIIVQKLDFREATIDQALETLSKITELNLGPQMISHGVMNRRVTFSADNISLRQALSLLSREFGRGGGYTAGLKIFPAPGRKPLVSIGVSF